MPELPEVERAVKLLRDNIIGKTIQNTQTKDDSIVFSNVKHDAFAEEILGRKVRGVARYGKTFYLDLDGEGRMPVLHFGMTGNIHLKGEAPFQYKEGKQKSYGEWPPKYMKFVMSLRAGGDLTSQDPVEIAFVDPRRLGRIRMCQSPKDEPPISDLGFDPILSMPTLESFSQQVLKRTCPVKALLLDQSFSAGIGNWIADEVLYQSRIHPEQKCHKMDSSQLSQLHSKIVDVCRTAVEVNADSKKFPADWLFHHRWGKGKRSKDKDSVVVPVLKLPSGEPAVIKWITVGGRTSAVVPELQRVQTDKSVNKDTSRESALGRRKLRKTVVEVEEANPQECKPERKRRKVTKD